MTSEARIHLHTKFAFGIGATAEGAVYIGISSFNTLFYNQVLGLAGWLTGLAAAIAITLDAFTDPVIGSISDRWRSRLGRRHPFMFAAPLPVAVAFIMIYNPPPGLGQYSLFLWLMGWTLLMRFTLTFFHVPHLALGAELSSHYTQRSSIMSWNAIFGWLGGASAGYFGWSYFFATRNGVDYRFEASAYSSFAFAIALVAVGVILYSAFFTLDQLPRLPQAPANQPKYKLRQTLGDIAMTLRNRNYRVLLLGLVFLSAAIGVQETLSVYMGTYFWGLSGQDLAKYALASAVGYWGAFFFTAPLHRRFDKKPIIVVFVIAAVLIPSAPILLRFMALMPENDSPHLLITLLCFAACAYGSAAILGISVLSALADIADEHQLLTGRRQEGVFYASRAFFAQAINGFGHAIGGVVLSLIAFPIGAAPGAISPEIIRNLGLFYGPIAVIPGAIAALCYSRYRIDQRVHGQIQERLAAQAARTAEDALVAGAETPRVAASGA